MWSAAVHHKRAPALSLLLRIATHCTWMHLYSHCGMSSPYRASL
jgi:hypothetical protein